MVNRYLFLHRKEQIFEEAKLQMQMELRKQKEEEAERRKQKEKELKLKEMEKETRMQKRTILQMKMNMQVYTSSYIIILKESISKSNYLSILVPEKPNTIS